MTEQQRPSIAAHAEWLDRTFGRNHELVDAVIREAWAASSPFPIVLDPETRTIDATVAGYVPGDGDLVPSDAWSLTRLIAGGAYPELGIDGSEWHSFVKGLPTDAVLLGRADSTTAAETTVTVTPWQGDALSLYAAENSLRRPLATILERARTLGLPVDPRLDDLPESTDLIRLVIPDAAAHEARSDRVIGTFAVVRAASDLGLTIAAARNQLRDRGLHYDARLNELAADPPTSEELRLASVNGDGMAPWRSAEEQSVASAAIAATDFSVAAPAVLCAWRRLGIGPIDGLVDGSRWRERAFDSVDTLLASQDLDGASPYRVDDVETVPAAHQLDTTIPLPLAQVAILAVSLKEPRRSIEHRLATLGYSVAPRGAATSRSDRIAASRDNDGDLPGHPLDLELSPAVVHVAAHSCTVEPGVTSAMLRRMGYRVAHEGILATLHTRHHDLLWHLIDGPAIEWGRPISPVRVAQLALHLGWSIDRCLDTLAELGFTAADPRRHLPVDRPGDEDAWRALY
ncbi:hypothetical protein [Herbiconiux daphne]|uniref:Uncharacterized protein n=1 Tax=Herbiconiux daphne TaxID=2970914 RepID=A0ABT2H1L7_9MICO|nr:hypothetical protein [Herbiconiux daphne]MCS5733844.1 hypothetical protein [Herbiconiux daphne]